MTGTASALGRRTREPRLTGQQAQRLYREASRLLATALDSEAATPVTFDPRLRDAAASQGLFAAPASA